MTNEDRYGCPNCNGEGTLDEATYCDTCNLGREMQNEHDERPRKDRPMNQNPRTIDPNSGAMPFNEFDDQWPACGSCGCGPCMCEEYVSPSIDDYPGTSQDDINAANAEGAPTMTTHYHVVSFINGCLNDYDSGPYDTLEDAREGLQWYLEPYNDDPTGNDHPKPAGEDRFTVGTNPPYIIKIEPCTEPECLTDDAQY